MLGIKKKKTVVTIKGKRNGEGIKIFIETNLLQSQIYREERQKDLPSNGSLPKWLQWLELSQSKARSFFQVSHTGAETQGSGPSSTAFPGHKQEAEREVEQPGYEPALIWDPKHMEVKTLATRLSC